MSSNHSIPTVMLRPATIDDVDAITSLWKECGEGNVDVRPLPELICAIENVSLFVFVDTKLDIIVGTGGVYQYENDDEVYLELGSSVWRPEYRSYGYAQISVAFRAIYSMLMSPGAKCVAELYESSTKSLALLQKSGFRKVVPSKAMRDHAQAVSADPVIHVELDPGAVPTMAELLMSVLQSSRVSGRAGQAIIRLDATCIYQFDFCTILQMLSSGDLSPIKHVEPAVKTAIRPRSSVFRETMIAVLTAFKRLKAQAWRG